MRGTLLGLVCIWAATQPVVAQHDVDGDLESIASWVALDVATGYETRASDRLEAALPGWQADRWGNLVKRVGSGRPRHIVACGLDRASYAATQITDDGYLRVHRIGRGSSHPLWDQAHEAQQVRILTESGPVLGVVARSNGHFSRQHRHETAVVTADDLWIDVGARTATEVNDLGIRLLDPIVRHLPAWSFAGEVAGPASGARAGCAAVATVAEAASASGVGPGETVFVLSAQQILGWVGLSAMLARGGPADALVMVAPGEAEAVVETRSAASLGNLGTVIENRGVDSVTWIAPRVRSPGAMLEGLTRDAAATLLETVARAAGVDLAGRSWVAAPERRVVTATTARRELQPVADLLTSLVTKHAVPGHEWPVRRLVLESLPAWARERAEVDGVGNITVDVGPEGEATVFMAHMDEVGYEVEAISADGIVTLARRGGAVGSAWEGQTALLHVDPPDAPSTRSGSASGPSPRLKAASLTASAPPPIRGVFLTRDSADLKAPGTLRAWFGLDSAGLEARGIGLGSAVTSYKEGYRIGPTRYTARALDDRAGTTALLMAIRTIDPDRLPARVVFAWSVHEEGGLLGAAAVARRLGGSTRQVFSVDTFVSSDTPLESPHFAYAPLGAGPVLRAIENSSVAPESERRRIEDIAARAGVPLQTGLTQGGTDGTTFTYWGAPNAGLSWPGRYSHSPGEVLDLQDLAHLAYLIAATAMSPR